MAVEREPAPQPQYNAPAWDDTTPIMLPVFPQSPGSALQMEVSIPEAIVAPAFHPGNFNDLMDAGQEKGFKARLAIRPQDELDTSWKERHRDQQKGRRRVRRAEKAAQNFLDSRTFRLARVALIMVCGGMLVWLTLHLRENNWSFGSKSPVAGDAPPLPAENTARLCCQPGPPGGR